MKYYGLILFFLSLKVLAGDYELFIVEDASEACERKELPEMHKCLGSNISRPVCTSDTVLFELEKYFSGEKSSIGILRPAFGNGHLVFCTQESKNKVAKALAAIKESGINRRGRHLDDFIKVNQLNGI